MFCLGDIVARDSGGLVVALENSGGGISPSSQWLESVQDKSSNCLNNRIYPTHNFIYPKHNSEDDAHNSELATCGPLLGPMATSLKSLAKREHLIPNRRQWFRNRLARIPLFSQVAIVCVVMVLPNIVLLLLHNAEEFRATLEVFTACKA